MKKNSEFSFWKIGENMTSHYMIYGKKDCPHTQKAREDFTKQGKPFMFVDVDSNSQGLEQLLEYSNGKYIVPIIVDVDKGDVEIGYTGE